MSKKKPRSKPKRPSSKTRAPKASRPFKASPFAVMFDQAAGLAMTKHYFDAITVFEKIAKEDKKAEFADDALYNAGLCYYQLALYHDANAHWSRLIQAYPNAEINAVAGAKEFGRTAAKAHLGRIHCMLNFGDVAGAKKELQALKAYDDSYVIDGAGKKRTYFDLGSEVLAGASQPA